MIGDEAFESDLRRWIHDFYGQRMRLAAERADEAAERVFDRERHVLTGLSGQLMACIMMLPWWGANGVLAGLVILYVGSMISSAWALSEVRRVGKKPPPGAAEAEAERALASLPELDADARARLIRLMNLAGLRPTPRGVELLREELREARALPALGRWSFLAEVEDALTGPDSARLGMLAVSRP